jgi:hypothetical protein
MRVPEAPPVEAQVAVAALQLALVVWALLG